jgi:hypothetical protein
MPPTRDGGGRCVHHGGGRKGGHSGRGKIALPKNLRQAHSKAMALLRRAARAELAITDLHPETEKLFVRRYESEIYPPSSAEFILTLDQKVKGEVGVSELKVALEQAKRYRRPSPAEAEAAAAEAKAERQARKRNQLPDGW